MKGYILVYTTSCAFFSEELLKKNRDIFIKLVPTPREFSSDCGISLYFEVDSIDSLTSILDENRVEYEIKLV